VCGGDIEGCGGGGGGEGEVVVAFTEEREGVERWREWFAQL
jgi:hypothetical protein